MTSSRWAARFGALAAALSVAAVAAAPAAAEPVAEQAVEVTATFDKPSYQTGDRYEVTITVRNGADVAADIHYAGVSLPTEGMVISKPLALSGSLIPAGESRTQTFEYGTSDNGAMHVAIQQRIGGEVKGTKHDFTIPVTPRYIDVTGVVYADEDGDSAYDAGEEVPGVEVTGRIAARTSGAKVTTDSAGRFSFPAC
ncbi:hypothetical protein ACFQV2_07175 [Actinokineospora soli]|uniref:Uncharacterized protein n=1 Tax=Actinokineospora soli TaxID=1048753 RepID=A0ABW2TID5_9PSEU